MRCKTVQKCSSATQSFKKLTGWMSGIIPCSSELHFLQFTWSPKKITDLASTDRSALNVQ